MPLLSIKQRKVRKGDAGSGEMKITGRLVNIKLATIPKTGPKRNLSSYPQGKACPHCGHLTEPALTVQGQVKRDNAAQRRHLNMLVCSARPATLLVIQPRA